MGVKLAARSAKGEQGIIDYNLIVSHRILLKFECKQ